MFVIPERTKVRLNAFIWKSLAFLIKSQMKNCMQIYIWNFVPIQMKNNCLSTRFRDNIIMFQLKRMKIFWSDQRMPLNNPISIFHHNYCKTYLRIWSRKLPAARSCICCAGEMSSFVWICIYTSNTYDLAHDLQLKMYLIMYWIDFVAINIWSVYFQFSGLQRMFVCA